MEEILLQQPKKNIGETILLKLYVQQNPKIDVLLVWIQYLQVVSRVLNYMYTSSTEMVHSKCIQWIDLLEVLNSSFMLHEGKNSRPIIFVQKNVIENELSFLHFDLLRSYLSTISWSWTF